MRNSGFELQFFQSSNRLRAKTEVMEEISSQNSDLGLEDLDKLEAKGQAENTKRATSWGIKKFEKWCDKRKQAYSGTLSRRNFRRLKSHCQRKPGGAKRLGSADFLYFFSI